MVIVELVAVRVGTAKKVNTFVTVGTGHQFSKFRFLVKDGFLWLGAVGTNLESPKLIAALGIADVAIEGFANDEGPFRDALAFGALDVLHT